MSSCFFENFCCHFLANFSDRPWILAFRVTIRTNPGTIGKIRQKVAKIFLKKTTTDLVFLADYYCVRITTGLFVLDNDHCFVLDNDHCFVPDNDDCFVFSNDDCFVFGNDYCFVLGNDYRPGTRGARYRETPLPLKHPEHHQAPESRFCPLNSGISPQSLP